jgi:hypothetical protein
LECLLREVARFGAPAREPNLFSIGGRGHYEEPISDLLAFFLDPAEVHGFGGAVLEAFIAAMDRADIDPAVWARSLREIRREVSTENRNRIDLLLDGTDWVIAVENKILSGVGNPLDDYITHVRSEFTAKKKHFVLLCMNRPDHLDESWVALTYDRFLRQLSPRIGELLLETENVKWLMFFREFVRNLEEHMEPKINDEQISFVRKHMVEISAVIDLREQYFEYLGKKCLEIMGRVLKARDENLGWGSQNWRKEEAQALTFNPRQWRESAQLVLLVETNGGLSCQYYVALAGKCEAGREGDMAGTLRERFGEFIRPDGQRFETQSSKKWWVARSKTHMGEDGIKHALMEFEEIAKKLEEFVAGSGSCIDHGHDRSRIGP